ncbi:WASH complex subunit strumpellin [Aphelenchoides besseyi]|nr:WASH complex subunit strumpellin [Aphelenchoides besseyi]
MASNATQDQQQKTLNHFILVENCLIAEIYRISALTPDEFFTSDSTTSRLLADFSYFENPRILDELIETNEEIRNLDENFARKCRSFVGQFYKVLDEFCGLIGEFVEYTNKFKANENVMDPRFLEIYTLRCDALFLLGVILLLINEKFPGITKERIFVAHIRLNGGFHSKNFESIVSLLRRRRENFESCFSGLKLNNEFVDNMLNFLRSYTFVQHNNVVQDRFATTRQSAMIYVCLWFSPDLLHNQFPIMRQICDIYFTDNWILPIHIDLTINVIEKWEPYKAASTAISSTISNRSAVEHSAALRSIKIPSGLLSLDRFDHYSTIILNYNKHFQWIVMHTSDENKRSKKTVSLAKEMSTLTRMSDDEIFNCLLKIVRFEYKFNQTCNYLISHKEKETSKLKNRICNIFDQLAILLNSTTVDQTWNVQLKDWILKLKETIEQLNVSISETTQVLEHLKLKIEEVIEMQSEDQLVFIQYFHMVIGDLDRLRGLCLIDETFVRRVNQQSEFIYLWMLLGKWINRIEKLLKSDALCVKFLFMKVANSIQNLLSGVVDEEKRKVLSAFYHKKLESALRRVIQVIPRAIFAELDQLHPLFSTDSACLVDKSELRHLAQLDRRRKLAEKTSEITKLSLGISNMCMNRLGPVEIKPSELLFDGLKHELRLKFKFILSAPMSEPNYLQALEANQQKLKKFRQAFVFVCEHVGINGITLWYSQLNDVVCELLEREHVKFEKDELPVPSKRDKPTNLLSHFIDVMLRQTNPKNTRYLAGSDEWQSGDQRRLEFSVNLFMCIESWLPSVALSGLQKLVGQSLTHRIRLLSQKVEKSNSMILRYVREQTAKSIDTLTASSEFVELHNTLVPMITKIGHYAILHEQLTYAINQKAQSRLGHLHSSIKEFLTRIERDQSEISFDKTKLSEDIKFLNLISNAGFASEVVETIGIEDYCRETAAICLFAVFVHYFTVNVVSNKKSEIVDHFVFVKGLIQVSNQLEISNRFDTLFRFILPDTSVFGVVRHFKNIHFLLPMNSIPV